MQVINIIVRSFISVLVLFVLTKLMGRKQIGQLNLFDYIIGISIGSIAAEMTVNKDANYLCIIAILVFSLVSMFISFITIKSINLRRFFTGTPIILIEDGKIIEKSLKKAKFDINDLLQEARINSYFDISEIEYALMEPNGRISFLPKSKYLPLTLNDMKIKVDYKGLVANLVIDGKIMKENLFNINKDEKWLLKRIENEKINLGDILLLTCDSKEKFTIYKKNISLGNSKVLE